MGAGEGEGGATSVSGKLRGCKSLYVDWKERNKCHLALSMTFFALMIIVAFFAKHSAFTKCFPRKGKERNHSSAPLPFHVF